MTAATSLDPRGFIAETVGRLSHMRTLLGDPAYVPLLQRQMDGIMAQAQRVLDVDRARPAESRP